MSSEEHSQTPTTPSPILRRPTSQQRQSTYSRPPVSAPLPRRQSTQDRISQILESGRERADSMGTATRSSGRSPSFQPLPQSPEFEDGPDETTGIVRRGNARDYQSTQANSTSISRPTLTQSPPTTNRSINGDANGHADGDADGHADGFVEKKHWWKDYVATMWSVELENKGSVARDHLALERTYLAWLRTSLAFASIGIAVTQLFRLNTSLSDGTENAGFAKVRHLGKPLGACFLGISILVLFLGYQRYFQSQQWVMKGKFPASRGAIVLISLIAFAIMVVSLVVVVVIQPTGSSQT